MSRFDECSLLQSVYWHVDGFLKYNLSPLPFLKQIEVDLGKKCWYHSIFACPILRQQTTDNNPPMKLVCGHIISRDALNKMFNGSK